MKPKTAAYALRLPTELKEQAERIAAQEGVSLNQLIVNAVAAKVAATSGESENRALASAEDQQKTRQSA